VGGRAFARPHDPRVAALVALDLSPDLAAGYTGVECTFTPRLRPSSDFQGFLRADDGARTRDPWLGKPS
jgi:hypothetical protein